jgi:hypothetical protein
MRFLGFFKNHFAAQISLHLRITIAQLQKAPNNSNTIRTYLLREWALVEDLRCIGMFSFKQPLPFLLRQLASISAIILELI